MPREIRDLLQELKGKPHSGATRRELRARLEEDPDGFARAARRTIATTAAARPPGARRPQGDRGEVWENHPGNQRAEPLQTFSPGTLRELVDIVAKAAAKKVTARAVATGYSVSDIATTTGYLIETDDLDDRLQIDPALLNDGVDATHLVRFEAGVTIAKLNEWLDDDDLGLPNQPSASKLTFVGGMMTASHGSGVHTGTLASLVRSLVIVAQDGQVFRIEPTGGISNREAYEQAFPTATLVQDDDWFYSAIVSFGSLGLVYSVTIEVWDRRWLREDRAVTLWSDLIPQLAPVGGALPPLLADHDHMEILVNPYPTQGADDTEHSALVTLRDAAPEPKLPAILRSARNWLTELVAAIPVTDSLLVGFLNTIPGFTPTILDIALDGLVDHDVVAVSHEILDLGAAATVDGFALEMAFPWDRAAEAMQVVIDVARVAAEEGDSYHSSPVSLRFVAAERAYLAPQYDDPEAAGGPQPTCMIEVPMLVGTEGGYDHLRRLQRALYAVGGRPHWGLEMDELTDSEWLMQRMYPKWNTFKKVFAALNNHGIFDNKTTLRLGLTTTGYKR